MKVSKCNNNIKSTTNTHIKSTTTNTFILKEPRLDDDVTEYLGNTFQVRGASQKKEALEWEKGTVERDCGWSEYGNGKCERSGV